MKYVDSEVTSQVAYAITEKRMEIDCCNVSFTKDELYKLINELTDIHDNMNSIFDLDGKSYTKEELVALKENIDYLLS